MPETLPAEASLAMPQRDLPSVLTFAVLLLILTAVGLDWRRKTSGQKYCTQPTWAGFSENRHPRLGETRPREGGPVRGCPLGLRPGCVKLMT